jgi:DNA-binding XRE family transcriptional regulator|nr:MAG TPA: helix-turn-helix protein [Caudoviricetes sp.]
MSTEKLRDLRNFFLKTLDNYEKRVYTSIVITRNAYRKEVTKMTFPNIEAERGRKGIPKYKVAQVLGVTPETYNSYVRGVTFIPANNLINLCKLFGCSSDYLLGLSDRRESR